MRIDIRVSSLSLYLLPPRMQSVLSFHVHQHLTEMYAWEPRWIRTLFLLGHSTFFPYNTRSSSGVQNSVTLENSNLPGVKRALSFESTSGLKYIPSDLNNGQNVPNYIAEFKYKNFRLTYERILKYDEKALVLECSRESSDRGRTFSTPEHIVIPATANADGLHKFLRDEDAKILRERAEAGREHEAVVQEDPWAELPVSQVEPALFPLTEEWSATFKKRSNEERGSAQVEFSQNSDSSNSFTTKIDTFRVIGGPMNVNMIEFTAERIAGNKTSYLEHTVSTGDREFISVPISAFDDHAAGMRGADDSQREKGRRFFDEMQKRQIRDKSIVVNDVFLSGMWKIDFFSVKRQGYVRVRLQNQETHVFWAMEMERKTPEARKDGRLVLTGERLYSISGESTGQVDIYEVNDDVFIDSEEFTISVFLT